MDLAMCHHQDATKTMLQPSRWSFSFRNPGKWRPGPPPRWLCRLVHMVFHEGTTQVKGRAPFLRIWMDHTGECHCWVYKSWTANRFKLRLCQAGLELTSTPLGGDAPMLGPCNAKCGLTKAAHGMRHDVVDEIPGCKCYSYPGGLYLEVILMRPSDFLLLLVHWW